jgi:tetratricopeptide (TPR) repeat protein
MAILCNLPIAPERSLAANSWGNLGAAFARQGHIARSIPFFERAVREEPNSADMHYNLGLAYAQIGQPHRAVEQFRYAQRLVPDLIEVDYQLADALEQIGDVPEAIHHYKRALAINPQDHDARAALQRLQPDSTSD